MGLGDVFGLDRVYDNQLQNYTNYSSETVSSYGYYFSGYVGPDYSSKVERLDYSNETMKDVGSILDATSGDGDCVETTDYGYYSIGLGGGFRSTFRRLDFSNEVVSAPPMTLHSNKGAQRGVSSPSYGYIAGGWFNPPSVTFCNIDRLDFNTETINAQTGANQQLTGTRRYLTSTESSVNGYFMAGDSPVGGVTNGIIKLSFSSETTSNAPSVLSYATTFAGTVKSAGYGYIAGGSSPSVPGVVSTVDRLDFSTDGVSQLPNSLSAGNYDPCGSQSSTYGYYAGGDETPSPRVSKIHRLDFDTSTVSLLGNRTIQPAIRFAAGTQGGSKITRGTPNFENWNESATYGYVMLGTEGPTGADSSSVFRIDHTNETTSLPTAKQSITARAKNSRMQDNQYGFNFGGQGAPPTTYFSQFDRLDFLSETLSRLTNIPVADNSITSIDNDDIGYFIGGSSSTSPAPSSNYHRFDFKTDNVSYSKPSAVFNYIGSRGSLTFEDPSLRYGYVQGSYRPGTPQSLVARMEFSTETEVLSTPLLDSLAYGATAASKYHGYVISGFSNPSANTNRTRKFEWATETYGTIADTIAEKRRLHSASQTGDSAWVMGGYKDDSPAGYTCTIERIDFETDTYSSPGNNFSIYLSQGSSHQGGSSLRQVGRNNRNDSRAGLDNQGRQTTASYGYDAGGIAGANIANINRFDMLNETNNEISSTLTTVRRIMDSVSTNNFGYFGGGLGPVTYSIIDRLDFTNESITRISSVLSESKVGSIGSHSYNYGYFMGGSLFPVVTCSVDRLDFNTETSSQNQNSIRNGQTTFNNQYSYILNDGTNFSRFDLLNELYSTTTGITLTETSTAKWSVNSPRFGYYISLNSSPFSNKLEFSTETTSTFSDSLTINKFNPHVYHNTNYGYFGGGYSSPGIYYSSVDRIDYSTELISNTGSPAGRSKQQAAGVENAP
jgi:hypothetical protein